MKKKLAILGSTGSIGTQALEVVSQHADRYEVSVLTANKQADLLIAQARQFRPAAVVISDEEKYSI
ncbi:MAG: 1-deoxy-D-xylulose-5-phosphate reductoisomerase, partial [Prevotellaceae bacterium]|nr:1-deoxy-D-xylulose-5-phosphate reductoisomerase [Prevotellaceae bacterium]